ncbi:DNA-processing protein DprA [Sphingomonas solaris]|uniref:DNA-protecting protein DprA n=1 Tax=Alterirhizorhabdus solaris TaxID=2529389 RepID=A0A558QZI5_9SPHN|nr:DNA-processing protein DprA [Sphingomonas solaris]TVV72525.1 DNA-protecting protein DprA [Sphingomonas solaris]
MADADPLQEEERIAHLRLIRTPRIGPVTCAHLLARFGTARRALEAVPDMARRGGGAAPELATEALARAELVAVARLGARHLFRGQGLYPRLLAEVDGAPAVLIAKGRLDLLERPSIAMVGARNASAAAIRFARGLAAQLGQRGFVVASGLARGIDTAAHGGALEAGTIAVVAGGIDVVYPPENAALQQAIGERGLVLAEHPPGIGPRARHFPSRNRIIAGLALGTVVVEAAPKSGSLITARCAADYGREVMAVPGSPLDARAQGCNLLIREGAILIQNAADVAEAVGRIGGGVAADTAAYRTAPPAADASVADRTRLTGLLGPVAVPVDELIRLSGLPPAIVQTVLLELELAGRLERHAGGRASLIG